MDLCRYLRWKSHSRHSGDPLQIRESMLRNQVPFTCLRTCQPWGPDDELAAPECCTRSRDCYVHDPAIGDGSSSGSPRVA